MALWVTPKLYSIYSGFQQDVYQEDQFCILLTVFRNNNKKLFAVFLFDAKGITRKANSQKAREHFLVFKIGNMHGFVDRR